MTEIANRQTGPERTGTKRFKALTEQQRKLADGVGGLRFPVKFDQSPSDSFGPTAPGNGTGLALLTALKEREVLFSSTIERTVDSKEQGAGGLNSNLKRRSR